MAVLVTMPAINTDYSNGNLLVVIEYCVHVLDPDGIDWAVEEHPLEVRHLLPSTRADQVRQNTVLQAHRGDGDGTSQQLAGERQSIFIVRLPYV